MNIYWILAIWLGYQHVGKLTTEILQMAYTAHHLEGGPYGRTPAKVYKLCQPNNPLSKWLRATGANYLRALDKAQEMADEFRARYGRVHSAQEHIDYLRAHVPKSLAASQDAAYLQVPPCIVPGRGIVQYETWADLEAAYRNIYRTERRAVAEKMGRCPTGVVRAPAPWLSEPEEPVPSRKRSREDADDAERGSKRPRALEVEHGAVGSGVWPYVNSS